MSQNTLKVHDLNEDAEFDENGVEVFDEKALVEGGVFFTRRVIRRTLSLRLPQHNSRVVGERRTLYQLRKSLTQRGQIGLLQ